MSDQEHIKNLEWKVSQLSDAVLENTDELIKRSDRVFRLEADLENANRAGAIIISELRTQLADALQKIDDVGTTHLAIVAGRDERIVELRAEIRRLRPKNWTVAK